MHCCCASVMAMETGRPTYHSTASPRMSRGAGLIWAKLGALQLWMVYQPWVSTCSTVLPYNWCTVNGKSWKIISDPQALTSSFAGIPHAAFRTAIVHVPMASHHVVCSFRTEIPRTPQEMGKVNPRFIDPLLDVILGILPWAKSLTLIGPPVGSGEVDLVLVRTLGVMMKKNSTPFLLPFSSHRWGKAKTWWLRLFELSPHPWRW